MNKIIVDDKIIKKVDKKIDIIIDEDINLLDVKKIDIVFLDSDDLYIELKSNDIKLDLNISVLKNKSSNIFIKCVSTNCKIKNNINLEENSVLNINKFNDSDMIKELNIIKLNGENAKINYELKTICKNKETYDIVVYHNHMNTLSNIINKGVNIKNGRLYFHITSLVYSGIKDCTLLQNSRIINLTDNKCEIKPNLLIEETQVEAKHGALIGNFGEDEMFYLMSRGLSKKDAEILLVKGFLNIEDEFIDKYWR